MTQSKRNLHIFRDSDGFWRWHLLDEHHNIVDQSPFGFLDKSNCERQAKVKGYK